MTTRVLAIWTGIALTLAVPLLIVAEQHLWTPDPPHMSEVYLTTKVFLKDPEYDITRWGSGWKQEDVDKAERDRAR